VQMFEIALKLTTVAWQQGMLQPSGQGDMLTHDLPLTWSKFLTVKQLSQSSPRPSRSMSRCWGLYVSGQLSTVLMTPVQWKGDVLCNTYYYCSQDHSR